MAEVAIIVPVYNVEKYLQQCVESILNQTFTDFELILIDDGSTDAGGRICDEYAAKHPCVRVIHQENQGQASARNTGVRQSESEWIMFVDSDDVIHPQMLECLYCSALRDKTGISACFRDESNDIPERFESIQPESERFEINDASLLKLFDSNAEYHNLFWVVYAKLIRRRFVESCLFTEGRIFEDNAVVGKWLVEAGAISIVPEFLYYYRNNPVGTMNQPLSRKKLDYLWALEQLCEFFDSINYNKMLGRIADEYTGTALWLKKEFVTVNNDTETEAYIIRLIQAFYDRYKKKVSFSEKVESLVLKSTHPFIFRIKKKIRNK